MKRTLVTACAALATCIGVNAYALKVGIVDIQQVLASQHGISKIQAKLESEFSSDRAKLTAMAKQFQTDGTNFEKNKAVMKPADIAKKEAELKEEAVKVQTAQAQYQQKIMQAQTAAMKDFVANIKTAAQSVAKKDDFDMVFIDNSVLYAKDAKDITSEVLADMH